ncbi:hypothetical protein BD289DRAFT_465978 [Coniella lustricola]|uniref:Uncharacterized protein n=1 Tax=Coniella lustricola TaxID=2025994 RepID=A0A2T3AEV3_9PEZI|nr:hypothetical protein BD289DRAFT_465978 [Coniella lustricola]
MSSSSAATGLNRTRSLRQPTAGLPKSTKKDEAAKIHTRRGLEKGSAIPSAAPVVGTSRLPTTKPSTSSPKSIASISQLTSTIVAPLSPPTIHKSPTTVTASPIRSRLRSSTTSFGATTAPRPLQTSTEELSASTSAVNAPTASLGAPGRGGGASTKRPIGRANTINPRPQQHLAASSSTSNSTTTTTTTTGATFGHAPSASTTNITSARASRSTAPIHDPPRLRPSFTTLQQHYSPARNLAPKPLTSSYLAPPTPSKLPANIAISSETAKLQAELLQLHLLHRDSDAVAASWHASAREKLGQRFAVLVEAEAQVAKEEVAAEESRNIAALMAWGSGNGKGLDDKIQMLDGLLSGLWSLGEPGGRYLRVVRTFEKWADQMTAAVEARGHAGGLGALMASDEVAFIGELDHAWRDEVSTLARKLDNWRRQLAQLEQGLSNDAEGGGQEGEANADEGHARSPSSLTRILAGCRSQVYDMLAELNIMEQIEREAIAQEAAWIRRVNREDEDEVMDDTLRAGAIWRAF